MITSGRNGQIKSYLGYDEVEKQYKVLSMTLLDKVSKDHQVLTLGIGKASWRMSECSMSHGPGGLAMSINSVLYYRARVNMSSMCSMIFCFDFRSENYTFVEVPFASVLNPAALVNYNAKLGSLVTGEFNFVYGTSISFELYVLENLEKQEWSKHIHVLRNVIAQDILYIVGMTSTNELVLWLHSLRDSFYVIYYNLERKSIRKVEIQGIRAVTGTLAYTFLNHIENVKLMQPF